MVHLLHLLVYLVEFLQLEVEVPALVLVQLLLADLYQGLAPHTFLGLPKMVTQLLKMIQKTSTLPLLPNKQVHWFLLRSEVYIRANICKSSASYLRSGVGVATLRVLHGLEVFP